MNFSSINTEAATNAATLIDTGVSTVAEALQSRSVVHWEAKDFGLLSIASTAGGELVEEATIVAQVLRIAVLLADHADRLGPVISAELERDLERQLGLLGASLDDDEGSKGDAAALIADFNDRVFGDDRPQPGDDGYAEWLASEYLPTVLAEGTADQIAAAWASLTPAERASLIEQRPDLVINGIVGAGIAITQAEKDALEDAIEFTVGTEAWEVNVDGSLKLKKFTIIGEAGVALEITQLSDGTVLVTTAASGGAGAEVGVDENGTELSASAILELGVGQVLLFDNPAEAQAAVDLLLELSSQPGSWRLPDDYRGTALKVLIPGLGAVDTVIGWLTDDEPTVIDAIDGLFDEYGHSQSGSIGINASASATLSEAGLEIGAGVELTTTVIATDNVDGPDSVSVVQNGTITVNTEIPLPGLPGGSFVGEGSASITNEVTVDTDGNSVLTTSFTVEGAAGGSASAIPDGIDGVSLDTSATATGSATVTVTIPINEQTAGAASDIVTGVADGSLDVDDLLGVSDQATVNVTTTLGAETTTSAGVDVEIVEVNVEQTHSATVTTTSHTSYPGSNSFENDFDLNETLDNAVIDG